MAIRKKAAGQGLLELRRSPKGGACECFVLLRIGRRLRLVTLLVRILEIAAQSILIISQDPLDVQGDEMTISLGLDIGTNSVGSAWVDTDKLEIALGVSVFPAGVKETDEERGAPKNQARRGKRSLRRTLRRRSRRKTQLRKLLIDRGLLPSDQEGLRRIFGPCKSQAEKTEFALEEKWNPWRLRREGLVRELTPYEFGRVLVHLNQRRGAVGFDADADDEGKVKSAIDDVREELIRRYAEPQLRVRLEQMHEDSKLGKGKKSDEEKQEAETAKREFEKLFHEWIHSNDVTFGRLMADLMEERIPKHQPIRNRRDHFEFHANRDLVRNEFHKLWTKQRLFDGELAKLLTEELFEELDNPSEDGTWRHKGKIFGQRHTYWDTGTLGRCALEPTERCISVADRHAQFYRVIETVNRIRVCFDDKSERPLASDERQKVIALLRGPLFKKSKGKLESKQLASVSDIRDVLGLKPRDKSVRLSIENDEDQEINTDWFCREVVYGAIGVDEWENMDESQREIINRAILKFNPDEQKHADKLRQGAIDWWKLSTNAADKLIEAWRRRPRLEKRLNLSRRAIRNLLPYMNRFDQANNRWPTQQEARKQFAEDENATDVTTGRPLDEHAIRRYSTGTLGATASDRHYMKEEKHQIVCDDGTILPPLPPAPTLSNPVVRKAIHEVRRHVIAYLRKFGRKPHRVVIELPRSAKQSAKVRNAQLARNRFREKERKKIIEEFGLGTLTKNQERAAVDRVLLARQQKWECPYCGVGGLNDSRAAAGRDLEIDHIVPYSRCGDNGLNNKVLCHIECNRQKGKKTPKDWWLDTFQERSRFAKKLFDGIKPEGKSYFTKKDYASKWHNFVRKVKDNEWRNSQGSDTAYASKQVMAYLADALFDGKGLPERGGERKIFSTIGKYTFMLRRDWQLFEKLKKSRRDGEVIVSRDDEEAIEKKDRGDHRQHAIDAVVIALTTPDIISTIAQRAAKEEEVFAEHGHWPGQKSRREACRRCKAYYDKSGKWIGVFPPMEFPKQWGDVKQFRRFVLSKVYDAFDQQDDEPTTPLVVAHRPIKRRLVDALHKETLYGVVEGNDTMFTGRIFCFNPPDTWLKPGHLRLPVPEKKKQSINRLIEEFVSEGATKKEARERAKEIVESSDFVPNKVDPAPGKSGLVRDLTLRTHICQCLRAHGLDPEKYGKADMKRLVEEEKLRMYTKEEWDRNKDAKLPEKPSGIPIRRVVLLRVHKDPVIVPRKKPDPITGKNVPDDDPGSVRVYEARNNHHFEIRTSDDKNGKEVWSSDKVITTFTVAQRLADRLRKLNELEKPFRYLRQKLSKKERKGLTKEEIHDLSTRRRHEWKEVLRKLKLQRKALIEAHPIVDRSDNDDKGGRFVMSLCEGEMVYARRWKPKDGATPGCAFGDPDYFVVAKLDKSSIEFAPHWDGRKASEQDRWSVSIADLRKCGPDPNSEEPPHKVRVSPLGQVVKLLRD